MFTFINVIAKGLFLLQLSFACSPAFYVNMGKSYKHKSFSSTCFWYYKKHSNNDNNIWSLLSSAHFSNNFFINDFQYLSTIQIWWNLSEHDYYLTSTKFSFSKLFSITFAEYVSFSHQAKTLNTDLFQFNIKFSKYKRDPLCLLFYFHIY